MKGHAPLQFLGEHKEQPEGSELEIKGSHQDSVSLKADTSSQDPGPADFCMSESGAQKNIINCKN